MLIGSPLLSTNWPSSLLAALFRVSRPERAGDRRCEGQSLFAASLLSLLAGCGSSATCGVCDRSFTDGECDAFALSQGCESGVAELDAICEPPTQGCAFEGCPPGEPIACRLVEDTDR